MADTTSAPDSGRKLFFGLFVFPLLIAVCMAVLLCTVVLMTHETETPESLVVALKKSSPSKRWQKAFELSNELNRKTKEPLNLSVLREMTEILGDGERFDAKTRSYIAIALSHHPTTESLTALKAALNDPDEEVRVHSIWSLGRSGDLSSATLLEKALTDESPAVRKTAAYALGALGSESSGAALIRALNDPVEDVRWNAALALARLGSADGYGVIVSMLERERLSANLNLSEPEMESVMINAMKGLALIPREDSIKILQNISKNDRNLKVRQAAIDAMQHLEKLFIQ